MLMKIKFFYNKFLFKFSFIFSFLNELDWWKLKLTK